MNQYERIVSYIYQYRQNEKGANVGYIRLEKRGNTCRLFVQMRAMLIKSMPKVYLYQQLERGINKIYAGQMTARGGSMLFKADSSTEKIFGSEQGIEEVDGVFIDTEEEVYFASSWKNDNFYLGEREDGVNSPKIDQTAMVEEAGQTEDLTESDAAKELGEQVETSQETSAVRKSGGEGERKADLAAGHEEEKNEQKQVKENVSPQEVFLEREKEAESMAAAKTGDAAAAESDTEKTVSEENDVQMQSICGVCPFKRKTYDYGKKILMTFPSMKPFQEGIAKACVRMELQDIGCLPIASWSLSGNRFLLHGYYCYRHLLFAQMLDGRYVLGVPGIYSDRERKNALRFGFSDFQSIGDFGRQQGAFGYWLLALPEENQRFSFK